MPAPQHTERAFRRYEHNIAQVLSNWPSATVFEPLNFLCPLSPNTFRNRIRDAWGAYVANKWESKHVEHLAASIAWLNLRVALVGDSVYVGHVDEMTKKKMVNEEVTKMEKLKQCLKWYSEQENGNRAMKVLMEVFGSKSDEPVVE